MTKQRLDVLLAQRGLAESREQAQRLILAGKVSVAQQRATKAGHRYDESVTISLASPPPFFRLIDSNSGEPEFQQFIDELRATEAVS